MLQRPCRDNIFLRHEEEYGSTIGTGPVKAPTLLEVVRLKLRVKHYSLRTERAYVGWIRRFVIANGKRHPRQLGSSEVESFLSALAVENDVAPSTQNQALSAILFLYRVVLQIELPWMESIVRAKPSQRVPTVLSVDEVRRLLAATEGRAQLVASLLYGTGMRLMEGLRLRIKDVDFARNEITIRDGKGWQGSPHRVAAIAGRLDAATDRTCARDSPC